MAITGSVKTLYEDKEKTEAIFPRTKMSAVSDENNKGLDAIITDIQNQIGDVETVLTNILGV